MPSSITPLHGYLQPVASGYTHNLLVSYYQNTSKAFQTLQTISSGYTHNNLRTSSFQYITNSISAVTITFDEGSPSADIVDVEPIQTVETSPSTDTTELIVTDVIAFDEVSPSIDTLSTIILDMLTVGITVQILEDDSFETDSILVINTYENEQFTTNISILPNNYAAVTIASSISNPFQPTVIVNGSYYVQNNSTDPYYNPPIPPPPLGNVNTYVSIDCSAIAGLPLEDVYSWSLQLSDAGGSFEITSLNAPGTLGSYIPIFGLQGTITKLGRVNANSAYGYKTSGVFGPPGANKQVIFELPANLNMNNLLPNQTMQQPKSQYWQTYAAAADAIGLAASLSIAWAVPDAPLLDFYPQSGSKTLDALSSLAEGVGGRLRWMGNNQYIVVYPNQSLGSWLIPNCSLINSGGLSYQYLLDLEGYTPPFFLPIIVWPSYLISNIQKANVINDPGNSKIANTNKLGGGGFTTVQRIGGTSKYINSSSGSTPADPSFIVDLPDDTYNVYVQVVVPAGGDLSILYGCTYDLDPSSPNAIALNRETWFNVNGINQGISQRQIMGADGSWKRQLVIDHNFFTHGNTSVDNGQFNLNVGVERLSLNGSSFDKAQSEAQAQQNYILSKEQQRYKFVQSYTGSIESVFFGSIPLPGMNTSITVGGVSVSGIIESVNFSFPGTLSIQVAQYQQLDFYTNMRTWTLNQGTVI